MGAGRLRLAPLWHKCQAGCCRQRCPGTPGFPRGIPAIPQGLLWHRARLPQARPPPHASGFSRLFRQLPSAGAPSEPAAGLGPAPCCPLRAGTSPAPRFGAVQHLQLHFSDMIAFSRPREPGSCRAFDQGAGRMEAQRGTGCMLQTGAAPLPGAAGLRGAPEPGHRGWKLSGKFAARMPSTGQLQAMRRAGRCSAGSALWCRLCPVPARSRGLAEH